ncbi:hypothetical protein FQR65_LT09099 [Abscondita terminalis]|nr:hypothetical protein FQR65_LT09099 [Abscondita terminalis]
MGPGGGWIFKKIKKVDIGCGEMDHDGMDSDTILSSIPDMKLIDKRDPLKYDPDFHGPLRYRSCTDVLCLMLFLVFIGCWIGIGLFAFVRGNPSVTFAPKDSQGARCGLDSHVIDKPYLFFFDLTKCLEPIPFTGCRTKQICVKKCPDKTFMYNGNVNNIYDIICEPGVTPTQYNINQFIAEEKCARWYLPSEPVFKRCLYNVADRRLLNLDVSRIKGDEIKLMRNRLSTSASWLALLVQSTINLFADHDKYMQLGQEIVEDIMNTWKHILVALVLALLVCIIYIVLMRWIAGVMVWISILGVLAVLSFGVYYCVTQYQHYRDNPISQTKNFLEKKGTWLAFLIILSVILLILLLMLIFLRKRIILSIALIKEASRAVSSVTSALFFPIFPWCIQLGVVAYAVAVGLYLSSVGAAEFSVRNLEGNCRCSGEAKDYASNTPCNPNIFANNCWNIKDGMPCTLASCQFIQVESSNMVTYLHVFNIFGFFWALFFVSGLADMILASTFATWYWTFRKRDVPFFTVTHSLLRTLRYNLGTIAFGSLIIAICTMIRVMLEYIDHKLKTYENPFTKAVLCCCKCFFWCLEKFIKFINRNAYIMCAIHGKNFCLSAKDAFNLLMRNIIRVFVLDKVTDFLIFMSKILVTACVTCVAYVVFATNYVNLVESQLNYNYIPVIIIAISTFFVTLVFFSVFTMAVDTLFLCFLEDSERNDGSPEKPYFMSKNLMQILGKKNK